MFIMFALKHVCSKNYFIQEYNCSIEPFPINKITCYMYILKKHDVANC